ncbi:MAG: Crp/Fnr family transcriptional regulator [Pseudomonadota bacterium]
MVVAYDSPAMRLCLATDPGLADDRFPLQRNLAAMELFAGLNSAHLSLFATAAWRRRFSRGEVIFREGEPADAFTTIVSGLVKVARTASDAGDCTLALSGARESVGTASVLQRGLHTATAYAGSEIVEVLRIEAEPVLTAMSVDPSVAAAVNRALLAELDALSSKIAILSAGPVPRRLARLFLTLADRFGDEMVDGSWGIPVCLSRADLASLVGARVETVIRVISTWQKRGVLRTEEDRFELLRPEALRAELDGQRRSGFRTRRFASAPDLLSKLA